MEIDIVSKIYIALSIVVLYLLFKTAVEWKRIRQKKFKLNAIKLKTQISVQKPCAHYTI
jgi:hypothetical protein